MRFLPKTWNDTLSLILVLGIPLLWAFGQLTGEVLGATIAAWMLVIQFYFRRAPETEAK